jgi:alpha 1,2-mannosyltransferase
MIAKDYQEDDSKRDGAYTSLDRKLLESWAPHSMIRFVEIDMYSNKAIEGQTREQIIQWRAGKNGAVAGRDLGYQSMCRLWSGRLQSMSFLDEITYYMRMDDDSLLTKEFPYDPFVRMQSKGLMYVYRRHSHDKWGIDQLWKISQPHVLENIPPKEVKDLPFLRQAGGKNYKYFGKQPYNNFHIAQVSFWRSQQWTKLWEDMNRNHLFFKYRVGDANVHAIAVMMMGRNKYEMWPEVPYIHNTNDYRKWETMSKGPWREECERAIKSLEIRRMQ